jgi:inward rectifier potassium channel
MAVLRREEFRDLGFGSVMTSQGGRLLNRDGSFNVVREGLDPLRSLSLYHYLLTVSWPRFLAWICVAYLAANAVFALLYTLCGAGALSGTAGLGAAARYPIAFFFSVHTLATIGYGNVSPMGLGANLLVTAESLVGLLSFALASGIVFARFSRPVAWILFSQRALVAPYRGVSAFMFRIVNGRSNQLTELGARVSVSLGCDGARRFHDLLLEREKVVLFPLSWTIVHAIDETSPLWGYDAQRLKDEQAEFFITLQGIEETFSMQVHTRTSYTADEVVWGARFSDIFIRRPGRVVGIDVARLHDYEPVEPDAADGEARVALAEAPRELAPPPEALPAAAPPAEVAALALRVPDETREVDALGGGDAGSSCAGDVAADTRLTPSGEAAGAEGEGDGSVLAGAEPSGEQAPAEREPADG